MSTKPSWAETVQLIAESPGVAEGLARQHAADDGLGHCPVCHTAAPCTLAILAADAVALRERAARVARRVS